MKYLTFLILAFVLVSTRANEINVVAETVEHTASVPNTTAGTMTVTAYSSEDSCHYPKGNGCLTASGKIASDGMVACHKKHKFGTKFLINGKIYVCEDRYADYLNRMRDTETIDIWMGTGNEAHKRAKRFGIKEIEVIVYGE